MTDPSTDKVEAIEQMIETIIAVKGEPYYMAVAYGVNVFGIMRLLKEAGLPDEVRHGFIANIGLMWKHACLGLGFPVENHVWWKELLRDVEGITGKATEK